MIAFRNLVVGCLALIGTTSALGQTKSFSSVVVSSPVANSALLPNDLVPVIEGGRMATASVQSLVNSISANTNASLLTSGTLAAGRMPNPGPSSLGGVMSFAASSHCFIISISTTGGVSCAQPSVADISGLVSFTSSQAGLTPASGGGTTNFLRADGTWATPVGGGITGPGTTVVNHVAYWGNTTGGSLLDGGALATIATSGSASDIGSGTLPAARLPNPTASTLGGVQSLAAVSHQFLTGIGTGGVPTQAQPAVGDISGLGTSATANTGTSGATVMLNNANNTTSGNNTHTGTEAFSGTLNLPSLSASSTLCTDSSNNVTTTGCGAAAPAGYYISANGGDSNNGLSPSAPILTFSHGLTLMRSGLKYLYVMSAGGQFTVASTINLTSSDNGETIIANGTDKPVLDGGGTLASIFTETSAQSVRFQGLSLQNTAVGRAAIYLNSGTSNAVVANTFTNIGQAVLVNGEVLSKILGNQVTNVLGDTTGGTSPGSCTFPGGATGLNCNGSAFEIQGNGTIPSSQITVSGNVVNGTSGQSTHGGGVYAHGMTGSIIAYNDIENTVGMGIGIVDFSVSTEDHDNVVAFNRLLNTNTNSGDSGCVYASGRNLPVQNSTFMFNICSQSNLVNANSNNIRDWYNDDCASNNTWKFNISWGFGNGSSGSGGAAIEIHVGSNVAFLNNLFGNMATNANQVILVQTTGGSGTCPTAMVGNTMTNNVATSSKTSATFITTYSGDTPNLTATTTTLFGQSVTTTWSNSLGAGTGVTNTGQTTATNPGLSATFGLKISGNVMVTDNFTLTNLPSGFSQIPTGLIGTPGYTGVRAAYAY